MKTIVLLGPTGVGKTEISLEISENGYEIVSADSVQVYRYLNIGSNKTSEKDRSILKHYLIDIVDPDYNFSAGDFCRQAKTACDLIFQNNKLPLFVGGTAFYIDAFFKGLSQIPKIDNAIRMQLSKELNERGLVDLYDELQKVDRQFMEGVHINDKQRILRGLEVFRGTGSPLSSYYKSKIGHESECTRYIGINMNRDLLRKRVDKRVDSMITLGFIDEVENLRKMGYSSKLKSMKSIGYFELNKYLEGQMTRNEAIEKIKVETKRYAKRQMTWLRGNKKIQWIDYTEWKKIRNLLF